MLLTEIIKYKISNNSDKINITINGMKSLENCFKSLKQDFLDLENNVGRGGSIISIQVKKGKILFILEVNGKNKKIRSS